MHCLESKRKRRYFRGFQSNGAYAPTPYEALSLKYALISLDQPHANAQQNSARDAAH